MRCVKRAGQMLCGLSLLLGLSSCGGSNEPFTPIVCTDQALPAIAVLVEHRENGDPLADVLVIAEDGSFADSATTRNEGQASLAHERAGTYEVMVEKNGFSPWSRSNVTVDEGECHVNTVELTARLSPS